MQILISRRDEDDNDKLFQIQRADYALGFQCSLFSPYSHRTYHSLWCTVTFLWTFIHNKFIEQKLKELIYHMCGFIWKFFNNNHNNQTETKPPEDKLKWMACWIGSDRIGMKMSNPLLVLLLFTHFLNVLDTSITTRNQELLFVMRVNIVLLLACLRRNCELWKEFLLINVLRGCRVDFFEQILKIRVLFLLRICTCLLGVFFNVLVVWLRIMRSWSCSLLLVFGSYFSKETFLNVLMVMSHHDDFDGFIRKQKVTIFLIQRTRGIWKNCWVFMAPLALMMLGPGSNRLASFLLKTILELVLTGIFPWWRGFFFTSEMFVSE